MAIKKLSPHLAFDGTAAKAIALYEKALGAKVEQIMRFRDGAAMGHPPPPGYEDRVMHAVVRVDDAVFMVMDSPPGAPVATESNVQLSLEIDDLGDLTKKFEALSSGGKVTLALHDAFWGAKFGMLTDAFGIRWMLSCETKR